MALAAIVTCLLLPLSTYAEVVPLEWDANSEPNVAGYLLSYGTASRQYLSTVDVGNVTRYQFTEPDPYVRYYIAVQAYTTDGAISGFSNEVVTTPAPPLTVTSLSANRPSPQTVGTAVTFAAAASGGKAPYQFKWWIINGTTATVAQNWSTTDVFTWTPSAASNYIIRVWARDAADTADAPDNSGAVLEMSFAITAGTTASGTGLTAHYFNDDGTGAAFTRLAASRIDASVNFDWGWVAPATDVQPDHFSVRWTGQVQAPVSGSYTFTTITDDGVRLWVNGQLLIDDWRGHPPTRNVSPALTLTAGARYDVRLEYYEGTAGATAQLLWTPPGQPEAVIPTAQLFASTGSSPNPSPNQSPTVNAGSDMGITLPASATLTGSVSDDGLPMPPGTVTVSWSRISGPGTVTFAANASSTSATFSAAGTYVLRLTASDGQLTGSDDVTVVVTAASGTPTSGTGLTAHYFNDDGSGAAFTRLAASRIDASVNFDWGWVAPATDVQPDHFSVRWTGQVQAPVSGSYTFTTISDDGVRLWVNGQLLIDDWRGHPPTRNVSPALTLTAGARYDVRLEYYEGTAGATAQLLWTPPGQAEAVIPTAQLFPSSASTVPNQAGLAAEYFNDPGSAGSFTALAASRIDTTVNFDWGWNTPVDNVQADYFSARWRGKVLAPTSGEYTFATISDDGVRLWINGQLVIDDWTSHPPTRNVSAVLTLVAGTAYDIRLEYYEATAGAYMQLLWTPPGGAEQIIPATQLSH